MEKIVLEERVGLYSLLRSLYTYPITVNLLVTLVGLEVPETSLLALPLSVLRQRVLKVAQGNGNSERALQHLVEQLNVEMTRLLEGPGTPVAPPYASYYLHEGRLMGPEAVSVRRFYARWEAMPVSGANIPADHVALEFGFLAYLAQRALEGAGEEREEALRASLEFLKRHVLPWLPHFLRLLRTGARDEFFAALADFTSVAVKEDVRRLEAALRHSTDPAHVGTER